MPVNIHQAKTHFSKLIERVQQGEEIVIVKAGRPVARLVPVRQRRAKRLPGSARGRVRIPRNFDVPLPKEFEDAFR